MNFARLPSNLQPGDYSLFVQPNVDNYSTWKEWSVITMKSRMIVIGVLLAAVPSVSFAMDAETFYLKASALNKKGMGAMLSKDLRPVMNEMKAAGKAVKAENDKAKIAGKPIYCVPKNTKMDSGDALKLFGSIPAERRKTLSVQQAWREGLIKRYPC